MSETAPAPLKRTALFDLHVELGAKMVPFAGYEMPLQYRGIIAEHLHARAKAALFDVSHMGQVRIDGDGGDRQFAVRVAGADAAGEDDSQRPLRLDPDQELGALHRHIDERRIDGQPARMPAEKVGGAIEQPDDQRLVVAG